MNFRDELLNQGKSTKEAIEYLPASRQFYEWVRLRGYMPTNPLAGIMVKRTKIMASEGRSRWSHDHLTKLLKYPGFANPIEKGEFINNTYETSHSRLRVRIPAHLA
ncbi:TPA: hypothetical protein ACK210_002627 [Photobacterium damselae subsp. damselae]